jgi:hypothetical protein
VLSIILITPLIAVSAIPPCLNTTIRVPLKFGALRARFYIRRICLQFLKTLKGGNNAARELLRCEERGCINATCFSFILCLLICISLVTLYRVNPGALYFPQPPLLGRSCVWRSRVVAYGVAQFVATGTPKAGLYFSFACVYDHYYYCATRAAKTKSTVQQQVAKPVRACLKPTQADDQASI